MCLITKRDMYFPGIQSYMFAATDFRYTYVPKGTRLYIDLRELGESGLIPCKILNNNDIISKQFEKEAEIIAPGEIEYLWSAGIYISPKHFEVIQVDLINSCDVNP